MKIRESKINGCCEILPAKFNDIRGTFVKVFHEEIFREKGLVVNYAEDYYSVSCKGVLRGLHFQLPPRDHTKLVYCPQGRVIDVIVDLRKESKTYGAYEIFDLNSEQANAIYIPAGLAHGFFVLSDQAILVYKVTTVYSPEHDSGILWNSLDIPWPSDNPIISGRDTNFPRFSEFLSPF